MMLIASWYFPILWLHIACAAASGGLFGIRGGVRMWSGKASDHRLLRSSSRSIDGLLLLSGAALMLVLHEYPFVQAWLTVVVLLLVLYIVLGSIALRHGRTVRVRGAAFAAAALVYLFIISVAITQSSWGALGPWVS